MAISVRNLFPLATALWLQVAPMVVRLEPVTAALARPIAMLLRWWAGSVAVSGAFHAVSGATGLTITGPAGVIPNDEPIVATRGVALTGVTFKINSSQYGIPKAYTFANLPPGLKKSGTATLQGTPTASGSYITRVTGWEKANATGYDAPFDVEFVIQGIPPVITVQPVSQSVKEGVDVLFTVTATGEAPLTYQWFWEDLEINGTLPSLLLSGVTPDLAGGYRVRVDSPAGSTFSGVATLTILSAVAPTITTQPIGQTVNAGSALALTVAVEGTAPFSYAWFKDGVELGGTATNATLNLPPVGEVDAGDYQVRVTNSAGEVLSQIAAVKVIVPILPPLPPSITSQSASLTAYLGERVRIAVVAVNPGIDTLAPVVTWRKEDVSLSGVVGPELVLNPVTAAAAGKYVAVVEGSGGTIFSAPITVSVVAPPVLALTPVPAGLKITFATIPGREYLLEGRGGLDQPWSARQTLRASTSSGEAIAPMDATPGFFRIRATALP